MSGCWTFATRLVDLAHGRCLVEGGPDERVHLSGRVVLGHPVVAVREDAEAGEGVDEALRVVPGVRGVPVVLLVRDVGERAAHLALDGVGGQEGLGVHRVEVIDAVEQRRLVPGRAQGAGDDIEDDRPAQAPDVDRPRRRLRIVDDLRPGDPGRQLVGPLHPRAKP